MKENFNRILEFILKEEGGLSNDPADPGGMTYRGISRKFWPKWKGWEYVDSGNLSGADNYVADFYWNKFWIPINGNALPWPQDLYVMDAAMNMGVGTALNLAKGTDFTNARIRKYMDITGKHPTLKKYLWGWIHRALEVEDFANG